MALSEGKFLSEILVIFCKPEAWNFFSPDDFPVLQIVKT